MEFSENHSTPILRYDILKDRKADNKLEFRNDGNKSPPLLQGIRPRGLFTANPPKSKFNVAATPFISQLNEEEKNSQINRMGQPVPNITPMSHIGTSIDSRYKSLYHLPGILSTIPPIPYSFPYSARHSNRESDSARSCGPIALVNGTIQIRLRDDIRVDITIDGAVRVVNHRSRVAVSLSSNGSSSALIHPNGRVYQYGSRVEILAFDGMKTNNYVRVAKIWYKGVSFTSENCALVYLVDSAGTRTTTDIFTDMSNDYTLAVFYNDSHHGPAYVNDAMSLIQHSSFWCTEDGADVFDIHGFRISQTADGLIRVTKSNNKCLIRTSPGNGSVTLTTPFLHCTASLGQTSHLFVRRGERRMHFDGASFVVRNAGHSAGFDENNLLKVY